MEQKKRNIKPFDGEKYLIWKFRVRALLEEIGTLKVIDGEITTEWKERERNVKSVIIQYLGDSFLGFSNTKSIAKQIFKDLDASQLAVRNK